MEVNWHVQEFLTYLAETDRKPRTVEAYKGRLRELGELFGERPIESIKPGDLASIAKGDDTTRSLYTSAMRIQAVKTFFQFCANRGYISISPAKALVRPTRRKPQPEGPGAYNLSSESPTSLSAIQNPESIHQLIDEYIAFKLASGRHAATVKIDREKLRELIDFFVGRPVQEITARMIDIWVATLRERLSPATVGMCTTRAKMFFKFLVERRYIALNPAAHLAKPKVTHIRNDKVMPQDDLVKMITYTEQKGMILHHCVLLLLADSGCRIGELLNMNLRDLDIINCEATVNGKTGIRMIDFTTPTRDAIVKWLRIRPATDSAAVFTTREGRLSHSAIYHSLADIAGTLGIERFNPHAIRHRVGQAWTDRGASLELVRIKLGHADVTTTAKFYTHQDRERAKTASAKFSIVGGLS